MVAFTSRDGSAGNGHDKASWSVNANQMASEALQRAGRELI